MPTPCRYLFLWDSAFTAPILAYQSISADLMVDYGRLEIAHDALGMMFTQFMDTVAVVTQYQVGRPMLTMKSFTEVAARGRGLCGYSLEKPGLVVSANLLRRVKAGPSVNDTPADITAMMRILTGENGSSAGLACRAAPVPLVSQFGLDAPMRKDHPGRQACPALTTSRRPG